MFYNSSLEHLEEITLQSDVDQIKVSGLISFGNVFVFPLVVSNYVCTLALVSFYYNDSTWYTVKYKQVTFR